MHTRPYLGRFALCMAGIWLCASLLVGLMADWLATFPFWAFSLSVAVGLALSILARGIHGYHSELIRAEKVRQDSLEQITKERAWALEHAPEPVAETPAVDDERLRAWRLALDRLFRAGENAGSFSIRALDGVVGSETWGKLTDWFCSDAGGRILRDGVGSQGTRWGYGWSLDRALQALALGKIALPPTDAPDIQPYVASTTRKNAKQRAATVVDGVARSTE